MLGLKMLLRSLVCCASLRFCNVKRSRTRGPASPRWVDKTSGLFLSILSLSAWCSNDEADVAPVRGTGEGEGGGGERERGREGERDWQKGEKDKEI